MLIFASNIVLKQTMISFLNQPWPWFISGPLIAFVMFLLLWAGGTFGVSSNLRTLCTIAGAGKIASFFQFDWKKKYGI